MSIEAKKKPRKSKEPAVTAELSLDTSATSSASSRSRRKGAKSASTTKEKNPQRNKIAAFILRKYVRDEKVVYGRDMPFAYKLADRHPDLEFWRSMPIKRQIETLVMLWTQEARNRLTREWQNYLIKLNNQRKIVLDTPAPIYIIGDKVGEDYTPPPKLPRNALDFCR